MELRGWLRAQRSRVEEHAAMVEAVQWSDADTALAGAVALRDVPATKVLCRSRSIVSAGLPGLTRTAVRDIAVTCGPRACRTAARSWCATTTW